MAKHPDITAHTPTGEKLTPKQRAFAHAYVDPESTTFGNATQSAILAGYNGGAYQRGSELVKHREVKGYMAELFEEAGMGDDVRARVLADLAKGRGVKQIKNTTTYANGSESTTITEQPVATRDQLRAIELMYKVEGRFDRNRAAADAMGKATIDELRRYQKILDSNDDATE